MKLQYTRKAEADLDDIAAYSTHQWNERQAARYIVDLDRFCNVLAENPRLGRAYTEKHPTWLRMEHASHVIFYRVHGHAVVVQRILHKARQPALHLPL